MAARFTQTDFANFVVHSTLISLVNLLSFPSPDAGFFPRRASDLTVLQRDIEGLRMLKQQLDQEEPAAVRGFLLGVKALWFEVNFMLHQDAEALRKNPTFFADAERLGNMVAQADTAQDAREMRNLAYKLSVMLPFVDDEARAAERNATAEKWYAGAERRVAEKKG